MAKDPKGHGSNGRGYRGKYPDKIREVHGMQGVYRGHAFVKTNGGGRHLIDAKSTNGQMPRTGHDISKYPGAVPAPSSDEMAAKQLAAGHSKSGLPVTHDAMGGLSKSIARGHAMRSAGDGGHVSNFRK